MTKKDERQRFTLRLPPDLFHELGTTASRLGLPLNALILQILWDWAKDAS